MGFPYNSALFKFGLVSNNDPCVFNWNAGATTEVATGSAGGFEVNPDPVPAAESIVFEESEEEEHELDSENLDEYPSGPPRYPWKVPRYR